MLGTIAHNAELVLFPVISAFCGTPVAQNAEITWKSSNSAYMGTYIYGAGLGNFYINPRLHDTDVLQNVG